MVSPFLLVSASLQSSHRRSFYFSRTFFFCYSPYNLRADSIKRSLFLASIAEEDRPSTSRERGDATTATDASSGDTDLLDSNFVQNAAAPSNSAQLCTNDSPSFAAAPGNTQDTNVALLFPDSVDFERRNQRPRGTSRNNESSTAPDNENLGDGGASTFFAYNGIEGPLNEGVSHSKLLYSRYCVQADSQLMEVNDLFNTFDGEKCVSSSSGSYIMSENAALQSILFVLLPF
jgi:hypothetical protein